MRCLLFTLLFLFASPDSTHAVVFEVQTHAARSPIRREKDNLLPESVGRLTLDFLEQIKKERDFSFEATLEGVKSIQGLGNEFKVISNREMHAYGWCYHVDGVEPARMPNEFFVTKQDSKILWFYAYAIFKDNKWIAQCVPVGAKI